MREHGRKEDDRLPPHRVAGEYLELACARAWGLTPAQWREATADDRARMMAAQQFESLYSAWAQDTYFAKTRRDSGESARSGARSGAMPEHPMFAAMKARLQGGGPVEAS